MSARQGPSIQMKKELASEDPAVLALAELVNGATLLKAVRNVSGKTSATRHLTQSTGDQL